MVSQAQANYSLNIGLHIFILFTFLTIFFFAYISKLSKKSIQEELGGIIQKQVGSLLTQIDKWYKKISPVTSINWNKANKLAQKIIDNSRGELPEIKQNNKRLKIVSVVMIGSLLLLLISMYVYFRFAKGYDVHIGNIFIENIVIFAFIGMIEFTFFTNIASKYIPVTPDFVTTTVLERIKYNISQSLLDKKNN